ncbi:fimbrial protein [Pseudomonas taiwanensis]|uniref:fimbrial protein n=1 Tax=Pseudomonas taiwanensis TaxID=470150 RepID=UPI0012DE0152|nr:fimbrial protein [Pseudomonas taiwanensis]
MPSYESRHIILAAAFIASAPSEAAICTANPGFKPLIMNFSTSKINLNIPRDTPNGTMVYESFLGSGKNEGSYHCTGPSNVGIIANPPLSNHATKGVLFEIPGTGLSWSVGEKSYNERITTTTGDLITGGSWNISLTKTGEITDTTKVLNGTLGTYRRDQLDIIKINVNLTLTQQAASCSSPDVQVNMGTTNTVSSVDSTTPNLVSYNINLFNCPKEINTIKYTLKANTPIIDADAGIVELTPDSTARGIGIQLFDGNDQPIKLDQVMTFTDYTSNSGGSVQIPLKAAYYRRPIQL